MAQVNTYSVTERPLFLRRIGAGLLCRPPCRTLRDTMQSLEVAHRYQLLFQILHAMKPLLAAVLLCRHPFRIHHVMKSWRAADRHCQRPFRIRRAPKSWPAVARLCRLPCPTRQSLRRSRLSELALPSLWLQAGKISCSALRAGRPPVLSCLLTTGAGLAGRILPRLPAVPVNVSRRSWQRTNSSLVPVLRPACFFVYPPVTLC